ncbi:MAG: hypothetical protein U5R48_06505 [Gammaproteobacteria bacterium]|nr:hypothetical protein [Gammaproteobacteria bacterium]
MMSTASTSRSGSWPGARNDGRTIEAANRLADDVPGAVTALAGELTEGDRRIGLGPGDGRGRDRAWTSTWPQTRTRRKPQPRRRTPISTAWTSSWNPRRPPPRIPARISDLALDLDEDGGQGGTGRRPAAGRGRHAA